MINAPIRLILLEFEAIAKTPSAVDVRRTRIPSQLVKKRLTMSRIEIVTRVTVL